MPNTLFGYLSAKFSSSPENLATEALNYILGQSPQVANRLLKQLNSIYDVNLPEQLSFSTQAGDETRTVPDMVGKDQDGQERLLFEVKFWAGLTENQPVNYLKRLPKDKQSALLFICPEKRANSLWPELVRRVKKSDLQSFENLQIDTDSLFGYLQNRNLFGVLTWRDLLLILQAELERIHDSNLMSDLKQLRGLCDYMDQESFLPLLSEELNGNIGRRILQLNDIVDQVINRLAGEEKISLQGLRATPIREGYRRYFTDGNYAGWLEINYEKWFKIQETPVWLVYKKVPPKGGWIYSPEAHDALRSLEIENPPRLYKIEQDLVIPIYLPLSVDIQEVTQGVYNQFLEIRNMLVR